MLNYPLYYLKLYIRIHNRKHHNTFYFILKRFHLSIKTTIISHQLCHILSFFLYIYFQNSLCTLQISKSIQTPHKTWTRDVCHTEFATYIKKYLKAKEELWKFKYFTMQKILSSEKSSKRNQNPSRYSELYN